MLSVSRRTSRAALMSCLLLWGPSAVAQANQGWVDPPVRPDNIAAPEPAAKAAHALAVDYLDLWSAPNRLTLAAASSFYGSTVTFHGRKRTVGSVLAEKRRFAERWPQRTYHYRPETTMVACENDGAQCTVWAIFDFSAADAGQSRRSLGIGEHELVVSLSSGRPVIVSETSRVLRRGAVKNH